MIWISNLSAKISYGEQGNDNLLRYDSLEGGYVPDYYPWQGLYPLEYPNANQVGGLIGALENKKLSWEKSGNLNVGIEASMFDGRLNVSAEYYNRKTTDDRCWDTPRLLLVDSLNTTRISVLCVIPGLNLA